MSFQGLFRTKPIAEIKRDAELGFADHDAPSGQPSLHRTLGVVDVTAFGVAAIIGAGIFSMIGTASFNGGPAVVFLFAFTALTCAFSALCYAEFASRIPVAGSAYTYAYASFGELVAWIIGWDLIVEYAIGNIAVAISWSDYFTGLLAGYGVHIPPYLTMDFLTASRGHEKIDALLSGGQTLDIIRGLPDISLSLVDSYQAWETAPRFFGIPVVCDVPALCAVIAVTVLVFIGIRESKRASNVMVALKLAVILMVIVVGAFYINPTNWTPFAPNGARGVLAGVSAVFFAYIGFDAISTTAEECKNPTRDMPLGMIYSLVICTVLYIAVALVLTGMVSYKKLQVGDPLAFVFGPEGANLPWISGIIAISAVIAISTVLLVFQLGQPRIWMAMSRDGLLPPIFANIHPRFKTPWFSTLITGALVAIPALFMNLTEVTDLSSIGTLFAFLLVCGGVLLLDGRTPNKQRRYVPYVSGRFLIPALIATIAIATVVFNQEGVSLFLSTTDPANPTRTAWQVFSHKIPMIVFCAFCVFIAMQSFRFQLSLIPVLGVLSCAYLMTELGITNWTRFGLWMLAGLALYFFYGYKHSRLNAAAARP